MPDTSHTTDVRLAAGGEESADGVQRWTYFRLREKPESAWFAMAIALLLLLLVVGTTGRWYLGVLSVGAAVLILWRFLLPVSYELDAQGVRESVGGITRRLMWRQVRRVEQIDTAFVLFPYARNNLLARIGAIYLPCKSREAVVQNMIETHAPWSAIWQS
jgi:hypothetical protein